MSLKEKYKVVSIDKKQTHEWLLRKHYAKRIPLIIYSFGIYNTNNILNGVITFSFPCRMLMQSATFKILELSRLVINENLEKNILSYFVSNALNLLPKEIKLLVSYADSNQNHNGYIYQATNWIYTGLSSKENKIFINGILQHRRTLNSIYGTSSAKDISCANELLNVEVEEQDGKHRYFFIRSKDRKPILEWLKSKYEFLPYPKGENKRYDATYIPQIQETMFV